MVDASFVPTPAEIALLVPNPENIRMGLVEFEPGNPASRGLAAQLGDVKCILSIDRAMGREWFHVSVSGWDKHGRPRLPTWAELTGVRDAIFKPDAVVVQVFPPRGEWFTAAEVLHLWQRIGADRLVPDLRKQGAL
jgi:hypothetical protein